MSRVIKFRAWNDLGDGGEMVTEENSGLKSYQILERFGTVMQFTGLIDPQGNEVYEGDILEECFSDGESALSVVSWCKDSHWIARELGSEGVPDYYEPLLSEHFETIVIGNIHQNPDLIKND